MRKLNTKKIVLAGHHFLFPFLNNVPVSRVIETQPPLGVQLPLCDIVVAAFAFIFGGSCHKIAKIEF